MKYAPGVGSAEGRAPRLSPLDPERLDALRERAKGLPEPLAALALEVDVAGDDGDATGVRKRLFELAVGVPRYAVSIGLAALTDALGPGASAPAPLADALRKAARLTDGKWFELVRLLAAALAKPRPELARALAFGAHASGGALVSARNAFVHGGAHGDDALDRALAVLDAAADLCAMPLFAAFGGAAEVRAGVPRRRGVWKKAPGELPEGSPDGAAFVRTPGGLVRVDPFLPSHEGDLRLLDAPHGPGKPWRLLVPETGEHVDAPALGRAITLLVGDGGAPRPPTDRPALVGREPVVRAVTRALEEASAGAARAVLLRGPQGAGLSRLVEEAASAGGGYGFAHVLRVHGSEDRRRPFAALRLALEGASGPLADVAGAVADAARETLGDRARLDAAIEALEEALLAASRATPILVAVDDAQWLDDATALLLGLLVDRAARGGAGALVVILAARAGEARPTLDRLFVRAAAVIGAGAAALEVAPLAEAAARGLAERVAPLDPPVAEHTARGSGGLPFYAVMPLFAWIEGGALTWEGGAWRGDPASLSAPSLAALVAGRVDSLFTHGSDAALAAERVVACVASDGAPTPRARVARVASAIGVDGALASRVVDALVGAGILASAGDDAVIVPQPIVARAIEEGARRRPFFRDLSRAHLDALAEEPAARRDPAKIARGYDALGDGETARAWYRVATRDRLRQGAFADAAELADALAAREASPDARLDAELDAVRAIAGSGDLARARARHEALRVPEGERAEIAWLVAGEELALEAGRPAGADAAELARRADAAGDPARAVAARLVLARRTRGAAGRRAIAEAVAILASAPEEDAEARYRLLALDVELAYETKEGGIEAIRVAAARARAAAEAAGSMWAALDAESDVAVLEADLGDVPGAIARLARVAEEARQRHLGSTRRLALTNAAALELRSGDAPAARARARVAEEEARAVGDARYLAVALSILSEAALAAGDAAAALAAADECVAIRERSKEKNVAIVLLRRADARVRLGDLVAARADAELAAERAQAAENVDHAALARLWLALHDVDAAPAGALPAALAALSELVDELEGIRGKLRPPTKTRLDAARARLRSAAP